MNMASLFREMTDAQRVRELEMQRFWLVLAIILLAILCAVLAFRHDDAGGENLNLQRAHAHNETADQRREPVASTRKGEGEHEDVRPLHFFPASKGGTGAALAISSHAESISTPSASSGRVTHQDTVTEAEKLQTVLGDKKHAQGRAVARPAGSETFAPTFINQNGRRILAVVVPLDAEGAR